MSTNVAHMRWDVVDKLEFQSRCCLCQHQASEALVSALDFDLPVVGLRQGIDTKTDPSILANYTRLG